MKVLQAVVAALLFTLTAHAQYITIDDSPTPQRLVQALVGGTCTQISNVSVSGWANAAGSSSYAHFDATGTAFPFQNGIVLATGVANSAQGPNNLILSDGPGTWLGDADLNAALGMTETYNATVLEFDFVPLSNTINFNYIFSSEEYIQNLQQNACDFTDGFAFLLKEAGSTAPYQNLALIPGTDIPVMVTTVRGEGSCPSANEEYFGGYNGEDHPTNYNGQTVVLTAHSEVTAGVTYHIKLVIADQGDTLFDSAILLEGGSFSTIADLGQDRLLDAGNPLCAAEPFTVDATSQGATGYQWYKDGVPINAATAAAYTITEAGTYTVDVQFGPCNAQGKIVAEYAAPLPAGTYTLLQCDEDSDGLTAYSTASMGEAITNTNPTLSITGYYLNHASAVAGTNSLTTTVPFHNTTANQQIYVGVKNQYGCEGIATMVLSTPVSAFSNITPLEACDTDGTDDGLFGFDLTDAEAALLAGLPAGLTLDFYESYNNGLIEEDALAESLYTNTEPGGQTLYGRINNGADCFGIAEIPLTVHYFGTLAHEEVYLCDESPTSISAPGGMAGYAWNTTPPQTGRSITVIETGTYTVSMISNDGCEADKMYTVLASGVAKGAEYLIDDFKGGDNSLNIAPRGAGQYEYSLDGIRYQEAALFSNLAAGEYALHIRDINGCGPEYRDTVYILDYPVFFTPNNDGSNDIWKIDNLKKRPELFVKIYDRYSKPITSFKGDSGWDGTLNGTRLPATDYWFSLTLENGRVVKGHLSLLR